MPEDSLTKRFTFKLVSKLIGLLVGLITIGMVPRALGPTNYGNFGYLTFFFARLVQFLKLGTSAAYFTKISTRPKERELIGFYVYFISWLIIMVFGGIAGVFLVDLDNLVWPEQEKQYIIAAAIFVTLTFVSNFIHDTNDAFGQTVKNEVFYVIKSVFGTGLVLLLYSTGRLTLTAYFLIHYLQLLFIILAGTIILYKHRVSVFSYWRSAMKKIKPYGAEFYTYSQPLFYNGLVVFFVEIGDRWLLQHFGGSIQQGFYSFALKLGAICFLFTSSMTPLFTRELSRSYGQQNIARMRRLFKKTIPLFYLIATFFAVFIATNAAEISWIIGGEKYKGAALILAIMAFYPSHQTYGHLSGAVFLATGKTKIIRNIGVISAFTGIILSFALMAPRDYWGLDMGAVGLALRMVLIQFLAVNIQLWINAKFLKLSFIKFLGHQVLVPSILYIIALAARLIINDISFVGIFGFIANGIIYTMITGITLYTFPQLIASNRREINTYIAGLIRKIG